MHLYRDRARSQQKTERTSRAKGNPGTYGSQHPAQRLRSAAVLCLGLNLAFSTALSPAFAQTTSPQSGDSVLLELPPAPVPASTEPLFLRDTDKNYSKAHPFFPNPIRIYQPVSVPKASFMNSVRILDLVKNGKVYLSLGDAITLALENNYDLAIARYNLDIADTDLLRAKAGSGLRGVNSGILTNTLGGGTSSLVVTGGPGGTSAGAATGSSGLVVSTDGAGPAPENLDPVLTGTIELQRATAQQPNSLLSGGKPSLNTNTNVYDVAYNQGFVTGTNFNLAFDNSRISTSNPLSSYSPEYSSTFQATVTQHVLQGAGIWVNTRFIQEAIYDRRITDSAFRQQILYTVNQVENIYWALVASYEDLQAKQRATEQSQKVAADDRKQLQIGTMAPLDVVTADSAVAADQQALISSQSSLNYEQLLMKQAIARNLSDPTLLAAPIVPTDRVSLEELPEEKQSADDLAQVAFQQRPELEQAVLSLKKDEITLRGARNALLPVLDAYAFYGASSIGGAQSPSAEDILTGTPLKAGAVPSVDYGRVVGNLFNSTAPDKGVGFNLSIPLRNRTAQADRTRSLIEYRQAQLRLEQLYVEIKMQVVNQQYALTNDRAQVLAAEASQKFNSQSLDAEQKKLRLGASTTALVLQQSRNLASAEDNLTAARAAYAKDRASLYQLLATTLQHYGISLGDAANGVVKQQPIIPGLEPAAPGNEPSLATPAVSPAAAPMAPTGAPGPQ